MPLLHQNPPPFPQLFELDANANDPRTWPDWSRVPFGWRLFGMFLLCLIPRVWMACPVPSACHDAYYYVSVASACRDGNWAEGSAVVVLLADDLAGKTIDQIQGVTTTGTTGPPTT